MNDLGKRLLELCTLFDLQLLKGCRSWDMLGKFTFVSDQGYSVVDDCYYYFMSSSLCDFVQKILIEDRIESDHMSVELHCNFYADLDSCVGEKAQEKKEKVYWRED